MAGRAAATKLEAVSEDDNTTDKANEEATPEPGNSLEAATGEVLDSDDVKIVSWHDLELIVPKDIPPVLMFDFVSMENEQGAFSLMRMFLTLLDGDQFVQVRNVIGKLPPDEQVAAITELSDVIMSSYGTELGESEASSES
jgi:hypothetical protein